MSRITVDKNLFCLPWTQTILGSHLEGKANFMALDWLTRTNFDPPMLGVCVNKGNASHGALVAAGQYSVNVPSVDMMEVTDYTGLVSGRKTDKSDLFEVYYGDLDKAPLIAGCPLAIECRIVETVDLPTNGFFIAEMVNIHTEEKYLTDGKPDTAKIRPFLLTMPDNRFWAVGEVIGKAWSAGAPLLKRRGEAAGGGKEKA
jgi:flavin reductase (DIM6/NTAB) family NADH-FMN oxidoreductase RutF